MNRDIERYHADYLANYGFEAVLVDYRRRLVIERLRALKPQVVLEIGCGHELLYAGYVAQVGAVENWTIIEPSKDWSARARSSGLPGLNVVEGFLEESVAAVRAVLQKVPDAIVCSGVLQEVPSAVALLGAVHALMGDATVLHVNVANARSFHRRLAMAMGLISALETMSDRNIRFQQHRVYDAVTLAADMKQAGFSILDSGGFLVKPFTHAQMETVAPQLGDAVLDGLYELGRREPDWACEIFVEARRA